MTVAVVILNWNGRALLEQFLPNIIKFSNQDNVDIYVADNASTDKSISYVKNNFPNIKIITNDINGGYAKGYNDALKNVEADIYALVNSDIEVTKNWLTPIMSEFKSNSNTAIIQPKILDFKNKKMFEYAGAAGGFIDKFGYPYCRGRLFDTIEEDKKQYNDNTDIFWASGACFFIRSSVYIEAKGFDEDYFAHQEEIDLCWRVLNKGLKIKYISDSIVYHVGGATLNESNPKKTYLNYRNSLFTLLKNLPKSKILSILFTRMVLDGISAIKFLLEFKTNHFAAILKAHFSFYRGIKKNLKKREQSQTQKYYNSKSIVYNYFVKGIKKYSELK